MRVIFVGMHNKPDRVPLCFSTKSGKLIKRVIEEVKPLECLRTNLYDVDYYPLEDEKFLLANEWIERVDPSPKDIIVLLGAEVHKNFVYESENILKLSHPAGNRSHEQMNAFVKKAIEKIKALASLKQQTDQQQ